MRLFHALGFIILVGLATSRVYVSNGLAAEAPDAAPTDRQILRDKILGMLVGSAIGDSMGAPTEMWTRAQIEAEYGVVTDLQKLMRPASPEGTWKTNLSAGMTTDDLRWKALAADYLTNMSEQADDDPAEQFARTILKWHGRYLADLAALPKTEEKGFIDGVRKVNWLTEWATVARAYVDSGPRSANYRNAVNRFYGGEMVCAGLLFSPVIGGFHPGDPLAAYEHTTTLNLYDIGYAADVSAITAAMTAAAMAPDATPESVFAVLSDIDPEGYFDSRLVGRVAYQHYQQARRIVHEAREAAAQARHENPSLSADDLKKIKRTHAYEALDDLKERMPFHAGEIHLCNLTALIYSDLDFREAMIFTVNYGRDNDTVAAVTGGILGAYWGAKKLPALWRERVIEANRELDIDLEKLADELTERILNEAR